MVACGCSQVARRKGPDGKLLSMGYGFVETDSEAAAKAAIKQLQVGQGQSGQDPLQTVGG